MNSKNYTLTQEKLKQVLAGLFNAQILIDDIDGYQSEMNRQRMADAKSYIDLALSVFFDESGTIKRGIELVK